MKNKKILIFIIIFILMLGVIAFLKQKNNIINENEISQNKETKLTFSEYILNIEENEDYSLLTIQTNIITQPFKFQYDNAKFVLDTSNQIFDEAVIQNNEEKRQKQVTVNLESNEVYKFYFIKKEKAKLELEKTIQIVN